MIRRTLVLAIGVFIVATLATAADDPPSDPADPPLRLKKKKKDPAEEKKAEDQRPQEKKPADKKDDKPDEITRDGEPVGPEEDENEVLERVARNMKSSEDRLINKELNEGTRQVQDDIVKDLDALIRSAENSGGEGGGQDNADQQNGGQQQKGKQGSRSKSRGKSGKRQSGQKQGSGRQQSRQGSSRQPMDQNTGNDLDSDPQAGKNATNPGGGGNDKEKQTDPNRDADVFKDAWGHLPEAMRGQMDAYANRQKYMDKHQDVIKQYYKTIAAQGRKKE
jgi:hypothetical protein